MQYYFSKRVKGDFESTVSTVIDRLNEQGFGVLTDIDVKKTLKIKLDVDFRNYRILGACNPPFAHAALQVEDKIGTLLPCNVIVQELEAGLVEVAAVDPTVSLQAVDNARLSGIALLVGEKLRNALARI